MSQPVLYGFIRGYSSPDCLTGGTGSGQGGGDLSGDTSRWEDILHCISDVN